MKVLKKIVLAFLVVLVLAVFGGYVYFDQKFTPENNYLTVDNESGFVPFKWLGSEKNALLLPIHFSNDTMTYYLQFDTGSPYTVFYSNSIKKISQISVDKELAEASFYIGKTKITSDKFKIYNHGNDNNNDSIKIIGTIGGDILENRRTIINFKENNIALNLSKVPSQLQNKLFDFKFKKRKIIFKGFLKGQEESFLFDSGTSAYELLANKEVWESLKLPNSKINIEKSKSWDNVLTTFTASCSQKIKFDTEEISLNNITYVEGFSQVQYSMMKFSGMTGMLGNKIFLNNCLYIDCIQNKMGIE
ncbi:hypothetical protein C8C83_0832 [Flavobacterium sp. 90]|uniref:hypothetical protein n=1 Tax=unclassified Flavobacterium TaxID=196869 RepID=UPI000EB2FFF2|nr:MULTISPECIES: hypothetical protein [unclassified Flavobacterium]RKR09213.1 hypothetical protein C8C82_1131 [Flavobacterium sp. 81]TCK52997.1 hypothetical protein C8C83_0832 [Flavobacterium sp. 90]